LEAVETGGIGISLKNEATTIRQRLARPAQVPLTADCGPRRMTRRAE
jgi:hypothetical protein